MEDLWTMIPVVQPICSGTCNYNYDMNMLVHVLTKLCEIHVDNDVQNKCFHAIIFKSYKISTALFFNA